MKLPIGFPSFFSKLLIFALLGVIAFQPDSAIAKIYTYKDENGKTHYTDDASSIPMQYRNKNSMGKFREIGEPAPESSSASVAGGSKDEAKGDGILSQQEVGLVKRAIQGLNAGVALSNQYKDSRPNFSTGQGAVNAIQSALPMKENLAAELEGTKVPALQAVLGFLKQSISQDKQTTSIGAGLKRRIASIFSRLASEGTQQAGLIKKLEQALAESEKKKKEARKKKEEEANKESEENKKKEEEEAKRKAEERKKKAAEAKKKAEETKKQSAEDLKQILMEE